MGKTRMAEMIAAPLALPYALIGATGGALVAYRLAGDVFDGAGGVLLMGLTALVAGRLGWLLSRETGMAPVIEPWWTRVMVRTVVAGGLNGVLLLGLLLVGAALFGGKGMLDVLAFIIPGAVGAWVLGAVMALPFMPSLVVVAGLGRRVALARPGSELRSQLHVLMWLATALLVLGHAALDLWLGTLRIDAGEAGVPDVAPGSSLLGLPVTAAIVALLAVVPMLLSGRAALSRMLGRSHSLSRLGEEHAGLAVAHNPECVDLGVGESRWVKVVEPGDPYRETRHVDVQLVGDPASVRRVLRGAAAWLVLATPVALLLAWGTLSYFKR